MSRFDDRYLNYGDVYSIIMQSKTVDQAMNVLHLPYVERKKGCWVVNAEEDTISGWCSSCGWQAHLYEDDVVGMNFCPNCGADMRGDEKRDIFPKPYEEAEK